MASPEHPACQTCKEGTLSSRKVYRLSGPAVAIGYVLLIPSALALLGIGALFLAGVLGIVGDMQDLDFEGILREEGASEEAIAQFLSHDDGDEMDLEELSPEDRDAVVRGSTRIAEKAMGTTGALGCLGCFSGVGAILAVLGSLLGWILAMKKRVLVCNHCGSTVSSRVVEGAETLNKTRSPRRFSPQVSGFGGMGALGL